MAKFCAILIALPLLLLTLCAQSHCDLEIETIEGSESDPTPRPKPAQTRSLGGNITMARPRKFSCIVCDDIKDKNCQPWDLVSHSKNCYDDPRINKNLPIGCRKMIQHVGARTYVSRHCTNLVADYIQGCVDRVGTRKIKIMYCHCRYQENCNESARLLSGPWFMLLLAATALHVTKVTF